MVTQSKWQKKREECKAVKLNLEWKKKLKEKGIKVSELPSIILRIEQVDKALSAQKKFRDREVRREQARKEKAILIKMLTEKEE